MRALTTLMVVGIVAGCSGSAPAAPGSPPETTHDDLPDPATSGTTETLARADVTGNAASPLAAHVADANLSALRSLRIFEVFGVIEQMPQGANCDGLPCPGHEQEFAGAKHVAQRNLADFTSKALIAAAYPVSDAYVTQTGPVAEQNLAWLRSLDVVALGGLILEQPKGNPSCSNVPCEEDQHAADEINRDRACRLASIAAAFRPTR